MIWLRCRPEGNPKSEGRRPKEIRNPKSEHCLTAEYTEHAEGENLFCRVFGEGMSFVNGAPWHTQDAVAERTETGSP